MEAHDEAKKVRDDRNIGEKGAKCAKLCPEDIAASVIDGHWLPVEVLRVQKIAEFAHLDAYF